MQKSLKLQSAFHTYSDDILDIDDNSNRFVNIFKQPLAIDVVWNKQTIMISIATTP